MMNTSKKKLNMNEIEQVNSGTIIIRNKTVYDSRTNESRTEAVYYSKRHK